MARLLPVVVTAGLLAACSTTAKAPDAAERTRQDLTHRHLADVSVSEDRDKGVLTLAGHVASDADKREAESIARRQAPDDIVASEIVVTPPGEESDAKTISADLDAGIDKTLKAELLREHVDKGVSDTVRAGVVTLTGTVPTDAVKHRAAEIASHLPHVTAVVDEVIVKAPKSTSGGG